MPAGIVSDRPFTTASTLPATPKRTQSGARAWNVFLVPDVSVPVYRTAAVDDPARTSTQLSPRAALSVRSIFAAGDAVVVAGAVEETVVVAVLVVAAPAVALVVTEITVRVGAGFTTRAGAVVVTGATVRGGARFAADLVLTAAFRPDAAG